MVAFRFSALALLALRLLPALGAEEVASPQGDEIPLTSPKLSVEVSTSFPSSEIFGIKLVNGKPTEALLSFKNNEPEDVSVAFVGGSLWSPDPRTQGESSVIVRNLTSTRYNVKIPGGEGDSISYKFSTDMHPQDLRLNLIAVVTTPEGAVYTLNAYNETVSVVEPDASLFDPQLIFLYLLLAGVFSAACYWIYNTWIATLFPQQAVKKPSRKSLPAKKTEPDAVAGPEVVVATGAYDSSWIPEHHIKRPEARRIRSGGTGSQRSKSKGA